MNAFGNVWFWLVVILVDAGVVTTMYLAPKAVPLVVGVCLLMHFLEVVYWKFISRSMRILHFRLLKVEAFLGMKDQ